MTEFRPDEEPWGDDFQVPARRTPGIPGWVWGCGGGCLFATVLAVVALFFAGGRLQEWAESHMDPAEQWPEVAQVLPVDEPPEDWKILKVPFLGMMGIDTWCFHDPERELYAVLMSGEGETGQQFVNELLDPTHGRGALDQSIEASEPEDVEIQGRTVRVLRFVPGDGAPQQTSWPAAPFGQARGAGAILDLSSDDGKEIALQVARASSEDPLTDEELNEFLAPFEIGERR